MLVEERQPQAIKIKQASARAERTLITGIAVRKPVHEFTLEHASANLSESKTKAHINLACKEGDIRLTMSRLVLERLRVTIEIALGHMPSTSAEAD